MKKRKAEVLYDIEHALRNAKDRINLLDEDVKSSWGKIEEWDSLIRSLEDALHQSRLALVNHPDYRKKK